MVAEHLNIKSPFRIITSVWYKNARPCVSLFSISINILIKNKVQFLKVHKKSNRMQTTHSSLKVVSLTEILKICLLKNMSQADFMIAFPREESSH